MKKYLIFTTIFIGLAILTFLVDVRKPETGINYHEEDLNASTSQFELIEVTQITTFTAYTLSVDETDDTPSIVTGKQIGRAHV